MADSVNRRAYSLLLIPLLVGATTPASTVTGVSPGNIKDLGEAVATVNDWRAIMIFMVFVFLVHIVQSNWGRYLDRRATDRLASSIDRFSSQLEKSQQADLLFQARVESTLMRSEAVLTRIDHAGK